MSAKDIELIAWGNPGYKPRTLPEFACLGMLDEYLGRPTVFEPEIVERFYPHERAVAEKFVFYLNEFSRSLGIQASAEIIKLAHGHLQVRSPGMRSHIDNLYGTKASTMVFGKRVLAVRDDMFPTLEGCKFIPDQVDPRFSYLKGAHCRFFRDGAFEFANASSKVEMTCKILTDLQADQISQTWTLKMTPTLTTIAFKGGDVIRQYLGID